MRRALLFISFLTMVLAMWAGDVSPEQALKQAQNFVQNQVTTGRRAPGATPQLALKGTVSGLYVFNVADDEGFVIVSNDDRTTPVLGYSTSGSIDPDNMPDNMRAWLQGYADEIAWMNEHNIQPASQSSSRRTGNSVKTSIDPLVKTHWDQGAPYNNLTPYYGLDSNYNYIYSTEGGNGWSHCATGCVATAMAQVMKYHQWPTSPTTNISEYTWQGNTLGPLTSTITFDWTNMQNTYSGNETGTTATAIATLMQYCGYSVEMDYGPVSGSNTQNVAAALKEYFDYNKTTQFVSRSYYSYDNWVDLIYFELEHNRPVVYGGASTGGGHEFVCDGYQYMEETDYFHINWGWGGMSDQYFVLSVLNPYEQGTGGSSSTDGFRYGQDAVIGIQPSTGTGTMSGITPNVVNLSLVSITPSSSTIALGNSVNVTIRVTNNSSDAYDGEVWLAVNGSLAIGDMFLIAAHATQDCSFTFTPDDIGTYTLKAAFPNGKGSYALQNPSATVTVTEDPTPTNVAASNVTPTSATVTWDGISESYNMRYRTASVETVIFEDDFESGKKNTWTREDGDIKNFTGSTNRFLVLGFYSTETQYLISPELSDLGNSSTVEFEQRYYHSGTTFKIGFSSTTADLNAFSWGSVQTAASSFTLYSEAIPAGTKYIAIQTTAAASDNALIIDDFSIYRHDGDAGEWVTVSETVNEKTFDISGLSPETKYEVQVQANTSEGTSDWSSSATFTTPSQCAVPFGLTAANVTYDAATLSWAGYQDSYNVRYRAAGGRIGYVYVDFENGNTGTWSQNNGFVTNFTNDTNHFLILGHTSTDTQYLITSKLTGIKNGSTVEFYQRRFNSGTTFQVGFSSTTADPDAFTTTWREQTAADSYTLYKEEIPAGTKYIAIRTTATEPAKALIIDDFGIYSPAYEEGSWVETNNTTQNTLAISGLTPGTLYEWQVQGNSETCGGTTDWCSTVLFNTAELIELLNDDSGATTKNTELIAAYDEVSAYVTLSGRTVAGNNQWNTFCLPFDISTSELATYLSMSQENITTRVLDKANTSLSSEGELTLRFTDATNIPAGTPFIMKCATETASIDLSSHPISATIDDSQTANARKEQTSNDGKVKFVGQWSTFDITDANLNEIVYIGSNNKIGYSKSPRTLKCMRAHFWIQPKATGAPALTSIYVDFGDGETTSIDLTNADSNEQSTGWYTIDGVKLSGEPAQKGLYIYNGKKVIK